MQWGTSSPWRTFPGGKVRMRTGRFHMPRPVAFGRRQHVWGFEDSSAQIGDGISDSAKPSRSCKWSCDHLQQQGGGMGSMEGGSRSQWGENRASLRSTEKSVRWWRHVGERVLQCHSSLDAEDGKSQWQAKKGQLHWFKTVHNWSIFWGVYTKLSFVLSEHVIK